MERQEESNITSPDQDSSKKQGVIDLTPSTAAKGSSTAAAVPQAQRVAGKTQNDTQHENIDRIGVANSSELEHSSGEEKRHTDDSESTEISSKIADNEREDFPATAECVDSVDNEKVVNDDNSHKKSTSKPRLRRTSSSLPLRLVSLPKVNCQERIILCIDHSDEMFCNEFTSHSSNNNPVFVTLTSAIRQFVNTKSYLNKKNQFSLILLNDGAQFITDLNRNPEELMMMLNDIASMPSARDNQQTDIDKIFDLSSMFDMILEHSGLRDSPKQFVRAAPPFIVRVIFVYGRSDTRLVFSSQRKSFNALIKYQQFFLDCVYIHKPVLDNSIAQSIFASVCDLDVGGTSHIYEVSTDSNKACLFNTLAKLLAHPLQRQKQNDNQIEYELKQDTFE